MLLKTFMNITMKDFGRVADLTSDPKLIKITPSEELSKIVCRSWNKKKQKKTRYMSL